MGVCECFRGLLRRRAYGKVRAKPTSQQAERPLASHLETPRIRPVSPKTLKSEERLEIPAEEQQEKRPKTEAVVVPPSPRKQLPAATLPKPLEIPPSVNPTKAAIVRKRLVGL